MAKEVEAKYCKTEKEIEEAIENIAKSSNNFKVGKTGETIQERGNQQDYQAYDNIQSLFSSNSSAVISTLEKTFINRFKDYPNNDNDKDGRRSLFDKMTDSDTYQLYVVWND